MLPSGRQHAAGFSPVDALDVEAATEEKVEEGRGEGRKLGSGWGTWVTKSAV